MSGNLVGPSEEELIPKLQDLLREKGYFVKERHADPPVMIRRFLRARRGDLAKAGDLLIKHEEWRRKEGIEKLMGEWEFPERREVTEVFPRYLHKTDRDGRPLYINHHGMLDFDKVWDLTTLERMVTNSIVEMEFCTRYVLPASAEKAGREVFQFTAIMDLQNASLYQFNEYRKFLAATSKLLSDNYPETLHKLFIINAPLLFTTAWYVVKQILDPDTIEKIVILGSNYMEELSVLIDPVNIPDIIAGGECHCEGEGGCIFLESGPWNDGTQPGYPRPGQPKDA